MTFLTSRGILGDKISIVQGVIAFTKIIWIIIALTKMNDCLTFGFQMFSIDPSHSRERGGTFGLGIFLR